jgi:hypothetical protein
MRDLPNRSSVSDMEAMFMKSYQEENFNEDLIFEQLVGNCSDLLEEDLEDLSDEGDYDFSSEDEMIYYQPSSPGSKII